MRWWSTAKSRRVFLLDAWSAACRMTCTSGGSFCFCVSVHLATPFRPPVFLLVVFFSVRQRIDCRLCCPPMIIFTKACMLPTSTASGASGEQMLCFFSLFFFFLRIHSWFVLDVWRIRSFFVHRTSSGRSTVCCCCEKLTNSSLFLSWDRRVNSTPGLLPLFLLVNGE